MLQIFELISLQDELIKAQKEKIELLEEFVKEQENEIKRLANVIKLEKIYKEK